MARPKFFINLIFVTAVLVTALALLARPSLAQEPDYDAINRIAQKMNCPTCTGINLADCRTQTCAQWRDQIGDLLAKGMTEDEVLDYFVNQYGSQVLQEPPKSGFTLWLWVLPVSMIILGAGILFYTMRKWASPAAAPVAVAAAPSPAASDDYLSQVEKDLDFD